MESSCECGIGPLASVSLVDRRDSLIKGPEGEGVGKISTYPYFGEGGSNPFFRNIFPSLYFYYKSRGQVVWQGSYFICVWKVKKRIRMSCFSVTDPFLTTFYYVEKLNGILRKNRREGLKNLTYAYMEEEGVKNCQNHAYVNNEWPLEA